MVFVTASFETSNSNCPVDHSAYTLLVGSDYFTAYHFNSGGYEEEIFIYLNSDEAAVVGVYPFNIEAEAEGGATGTGTGSIRIVESPCVAEINPDFHKSFTFDVPDLVNDYTVETFPFSSTQYVSLPPSSSEYLQYGRFCYQTFTYNYWVPDLSAGRGFFSFLTGSSNNDGDYSGSPDSDLYLDTVLGIFDWSNYDTPTSVKV